MPEPWVEPYNRRVMQIVETHGHAVQFIGAGEVYINGHYVLESQFAYSVGLTLRQRPELMIVGHFPPELMQTVINSAVASDELFTDWSVGHKVLQQYPVVFREVTSRVAQEKAKIAVNLYQRVRVLQMFLPDAEGLFPWQPGCESDYGTQACLEYVSEVPATRH